MVGSEGLEPAGRRLSLWPGLSSSPASQSRWDSPLGTVPSGPLGLTSRAPLEQSHRKPWLPRNPQSGSGQCRALTHPKHYHIRMASRGTASSLPDVLPQPARPHETHKQVTVILDSAPSTSLLSDSSGNQDLLGRAGSVGSTWQQVHTSHHQARTYRMHKRAYREQGGSSGDGPSGSGAEAEVTTRPDLEVEVWGS